LIQTIGRSARNVNAEVVLYADTVTQSMQNAIDETNRRRALQLAYNAEHGITPETIKKAIRRGIEEEIQAKAEARAMTGLDEDTEITQDYLNQLEAEMLEAAESLEFEKAAALRDRILELKNRLSGGPARPRATAQARPAKERAQAASRARRSGGRKPRPTL
jgi:excinuclease ABC subunit B